MALTGGCALGGKKLDLPPEEAVKMRAQAWADVLLARDIAAAYDFRTELLVVITRRVICSDTELCDVSREMRAQMSGLDLIDVSETSVFLNEPKGADADAATAGE